MGRTNSSENEYRSEIGLVERAGSPAITAIGPRLIECHGVSHHCIAERAPRADVRGAAGISQANKLSRPGRSGRDTGPV